MPFPKVRYGMHSIDLLAFSEESELTDEQIPAWHAFWYESEVQNGGHMQYFLNRGTDEASRAVDSLRRLGANEFADTLSGALAQWESKSAKIPGASRSTLTKPSSSSLRTTTTGLATPSHR